MRSLFRTITSLIIGLIFLILLVESACAYPLEEMSATPSLAPLAEDPSQPDELVKLIFIHHSTGGNWLADSNEEQAYGELGQALMENNYFVSATNYGWGPDQIGSKTDIGHWWTWFRGDNADTYMTALYNEDGQNICNPTADPPYECFGEWSRLATDPGGENEIIMFKGCFPNAHLGGSPSDEATTGDNPLRGQSAWIWDDDLGEEVPNPNHTVANAKGIYNDILQYFATRQDKLFVVITGPPLASDDMYFPTDATHAANYRAFNEWLVKDWLADYPHNNVAIFDYYNVLTSHGGDDETNDAGQEGGNHHRWWDGAVQYVSPMDNDFSAYALWQDSHPTIAGQQKATTEFVPLLNAFYNRWQGGETPCVGLTEVGIAGPTSGYTGISYIFTARITPANASTPIKYTWAPAPDSGQDSASATYIWALTGTQTITLTATNCGGSDTVTHPITLTAFSTEIYPLYLPLILKGWSASPPPMPTDTPRPSSGDLVQPSDFTYLGAFRLPGGDTPPLTFAYGGNAMTFNPDGNGGDGTLFITGHDRQAWGGLPNGDQVAEVSIPTPAIQSNPSDLPPASFVQNFHDVAAGYFTGMEEIPKLGMAYLNHPDTGPLIHLCWGQHLQPPDEPSHAWFSANLAEPNLQGVWFIGDQNLYSTTGYMFGIPSDWADAHTEGRPLATGRMRDGGQGGMGPTLFAYRPWLDGGATPISGTHLSETTLLLYENSYATDEITRCLDSYQHPDEWEGGAWMTTPSGKSAVLFAGTKSNGTKYWYGFIHPDGPEYPCVDTYVTDFLTCRMADGSACPSEDFAGCCDDSEETCVSQRGWWSTRYDAQLILYDPADLAQVAAGTWNPGNRSPTRRLILTSTCISIPQNGMRWVWAGVISAVIASVQRLMIHRVGCCTCWSNLLMAPSPSSTSGKSSETEHQMNAHYYGNTITTQDRLLALWRIVRTAALAAVIPLILLYIFGFSIKTSEEYNCAIRVAGQSRSVVEITGEPITPGLFAWITYFESGGGLRQGQFFTTLSGPRGRGRIQVQFYRTPIGSTLDVWFKTGGQEMEIYNGVYTCPE